MPEQVSDSIVTADLAGTGMRVVIERMPNTEVTRFHLDRRLVSGRHSVTFDYDVSGQLVAQHRYSAEQPDVDDSTLELAAKVLAVPGVQNGIINELRFEDYEITLHKGKAFGDQEVEAGVLAALRDVFGLSDDGLDVRIESHRQPVMRTNFGEPVLVNKTDNGDSGYDDSWASADSWSDTSATGDDSALPSSERLG